MSQVYTRFSTIVPSDTAEPAAFQVNGIYADGAGSLVVMDQKGNIETFATFLVGAILPISPKRVMAATSGGPFIALGIS